MGKYKICHQIQAKIFTKYRNHFTPGLSGFKDQSQAKSSLYSEFWSVEPTDFKNVIIENIHWALSFWVTIMPFETSSKTKTTKIPLWKVIITRWFWNFGLLFWKLSFFEFVSNLEGWMLKVWKMKVFQIRQAIVYFDQWKPQISKM